MAFLFPHQLRLGNRQGLLCYGPFLFFILAWGVCFSFLGGNKVLGDDELPPLLKTSRPIQQRIPLAIYFLGEPKATLSELRLRWDRNVEETGKIGDDILSFRYMEAQDNPTLGLVKSQFWISALSSAFVWQEPWRSATWTIREVPETDGPAIGLSLAIGMIGTASEVAFPQDAVVIGSLNPDGSVGAVTGLSQRLEAAAKAGKRRAFVPNVQRVEMMADGKLRNTEEYGQILGMEIFFVTDLIAATEKVLEGALPPQPMVSNQPLYKGKLFSFLSDIAQQERAPLDAAQASWPQVDTPAFERLIPPVRALWEEVGLAYREGLDAFSGGLLYVSWLKFVEANAKLKTIDAFQGDPSMDPKLLEDQANELRRKTNNQLNQPSMDKGELQSALVLAEMAEMLYNITARLEGAQIFVRQAFGPRSAATQKDRKLALQRLFSAVQETKYLLTRIQSYDGMYHAIGEGKPHEVYGRAKLWLPQLIPTYLGAAELFTQGLKQNVNRLGKVLLLDPFLATYARVLRDAKAQWDQEKHKTLPTTSAEANRDNLHTIGFKPGKAYQPPKPPVPPPPHHSLSDVARCLIWVNDYCELEILNTKYLRLNGQWNRKKQVWEIPQRSILNQMVQYADLAARRGIAFTEEIGVNPAMLAMIYENASYLRSSQNMNNQIEALHQLWRCAMLGNISWQLGYVPRARATEVVETTTEEQKEAEATSANELNSAEFEKAPQTKPVEDPGEDSQEEYLYWRHEDD